MRHDGTKMQAKRLSAKHSTVQSLSRYVIVKLPNFLLQTLAKLGATSALVALSKTESKNIRELICRVLNAICKFQELRGEVVQQVLNPHQWGCTVHTEK